MSKLWRALFIATVATGAAAGVLKLIEPKPSSSAPASPRADTPYVDADAMSEEQQNLLLQELDSHL